MYVLDASLLVEVVLRTELGIRHTDAVLNANDSLHVPHLLDLEVLQVIRRLVLAGDVDLRHAETALNVVTDLPLVRHEHESFLGRIWDLRTAMTAHDAAYVALAEGLPAVLLTCDGRLARAHGHYAEVRLLS